MEMTYWERRQQELNKAMEKDEEKLKKRLSSYFDTEYRKLEKQIAAYYKQYGKDNVIQYRRLMESLPDADKRLLIEQMDEFAKKYPEYAHLLPVRESIYKLNRLEGLQYSVRMQQLEIGAVENEQITEHLNRQAMRGANAAAETMGFGKNFYSEDSELIKKIVNTEWVNKDDFSELHIEKGRLKGVWPNTAKLANYLNTDIAQGFARGDSYDRLVRRLRERFSKVSRNDAYRLIYTEGTYVMAESTIQPFTEDFEKYRLSTVGDGKVCDICRGVSEETFDIADRKPGVNFPPLHPWCRCTFIIEVDDWDAWMEDYEKRHGNGEAQKIANRLKISDNRGILTSGARITDTFSEEALRFAELYYAEIRSFSTDAKRIAQNLGKSEEDIRKIKAYLFEDKSLYDPDIDEWRRFDPDCAIAQSWQRLMIGKDIKPHDRTLIEHELYEMELKKNNPGMSHEEAHVRASKKYDYRKEAADYYDSLKKHSENGG